jgi:hypothetical protein
LQVNLLGIVDLVNIDPSPSAYPVRDAKSRRNGGRGYHDCVSGVGIGIGHTAQQLAVQGVNVKADGRRPHALSLAPFAEAGISALVRCLVTWRSGDERGDDVRGVPFQTGAYPTW